LYTKRGPNVSTAPTSEDPFAAPEEPPEIEDSEEDSDDEDAQGDLPAIEDRPAEEVQDAAPQPSCNPALPQQIARTEARLADLEKEIQKLEAQRKEEVGQRTDERASQARIEQEDLAADLKALGANLSQRAGVDEMWRELDATDGAIGDATGGEIEDIN